MMINSSLRIFTFFQFLAFVIVKLMLMSGKLDDNSASGNNNRLISSLRGFEGAEGGASLGDFQPADSSAISEGSPTDSISKMVQQKIQFSAPTFDITKMREGAESNSWKVVNWADPISTEDESRFICDWTTFMSSSGKQGAICGPTQISKCADGKYFADVWYKGEGGKAPNYHLEIGAQHGACILEMLLETDAMILAFEPHPNNVYSIRKTISALPKPLQNRVTLFPIGLSDETMKDTFSYNTKSSLRATSELSIYAERLDSVLDTDKIPPKLIKLVNLDVQGFECNILEGMGDQMANKIESMKLKWKNNGQKCEDNKDYLQKLRNKFGFHTWRKYDNGVYDMYLAPGKKPVFNGVDIFASRKQAY